MTDRLFLADHIVPGDSANHQLTIEVTDQPRAGGAHHRYEITGFDIFKNPATHVAPYIVRSDLETIIFQNGPIKEAGVNGITDDALLAIVIDRLRSFQQGPYACEDNGYALEHCKLALKNLQKRTLARIARGVEGTHQK